MLFPPLPHVLCSFDLSAGLLPASLLFFHHSKFVAPFIFNTFHNVVSAAQNIAEHYPSRLLLSLILSKDKTTFARSKEAAEVSKCPTLLPEAGSSGCAWRPNGDDCFGCDARHVKKKKEKKSKRQCAMRNGCSVFDCQWQMLSEKETEEPISERQGLMSDGKTPCDILIRRVIKVKTGTFSARVKLL